MSRLLFQADVNLSAKLETKTRGRREGFRQIIGPMCGKPDPLFRATR
jgi:hypothetical protein